MITEMQAPGVKYLETLKQSQHTNRLTHFVSLLCWTVLRPRASAYRVLPGHAEPLQANSPNKERNSGVAHALRSPGPAQGTGG